MLAVELKEKITQIISETHPEVFVVDIQLSPGKRRTLQIKVDTDSGISLATCADLSRKIGQSLENEASLNFPYQLEVSSPGVGYPLKLHRQYVQNLNRHLKVIVGEGQEIKGKLTEVTETHIRLAPLAKRSKSNKKAKALAQPEAQSSVEIAFNDIIESKVIII